jgi:hypothetical protein
LCLPPDRRWRGHLHLFARNKAQLDADTGAVLPALRVLDPDVRAIIGQVQAGQARTLSGTLFAPSASALRGPFSGLDLPFEDLDGGTHGLIWASALSPATARHVTRAARIITRELARAGCAPSLSLRGIQPRAVHFIAPIAYDRRKPGADLRASESYQRLVGRLGTLGYHAYRLGVQDAPWPAPSLVQRLHSALDPTGILR